MERNGQSLRRTLALTVLFSLAGAVVAASMVTVAQQILMPPHEGTLPSNFRSLLTIMIEKSIYHPGESMSITIRNDFNETVTFGDTSYTTHFEKWNDTFYWEFYANIPGEEALTLLKPNETGHARVQLDSAFPEGRYRLVSSGVSIASQREVFVWGYGEFAVKSNA